MADVRPRRPPNGARTRGDDPARGVRGDDRAQLMLVAALALAVLFVSLALLLNTVIYTGNLATRSVGGESSAVAEYRTAATDVADASIGRANAHNNSNYTELRTAFDATIRDWDVASTRHRAVRGTATELTVVSRTNGTRLRQDDFGRQFLNESPNESGNWSVAEGIGGYRDFTMTVNESTLTNVSSLNETNASDLNSEAVFNVSLETDAGERYTAFVGTNGSNVVVSVFGPSGTHRACTAATGGDATVDFSNGTVGGTECEPLAFEDAAADPFTLRYANGEAVRGTYSLVVDTPYGQHWEDFADDGGSPYRTHALYGAEIGVVYRTPSVHYESNVTVIPDA